MKGQYQGKRFKALKGSSTD